MGTTSLTFQVSGVSELLGYIDRIQSKMAGLDQSMSKAQLSTEMSRVERLVKEAGTFANSLFSALQKMEQVNLSNTANGLKAVGKESVDSSGKVVEASQKAAAAATKSADAMTQAATKTAKAQKSAGSSADATSKIYTSFAGSITSVVTGYASIQTVISAVNAIFQEHNKIVEAATTSMQNYARVSGQLGQKAESIEQLGAYRDAAIKLATSGATKDRAEAVNIAYAMLSANMPIEQVEQMIPVLQAGMLSESDLSGVIRASGPLMTLDKSLDITQLLSMAMAASKSNVSDTSKIIQGVADSALMNKEIGTTTEESFAIADVIAQSTHNADEARTWQKNFTKDVWKRVLAKAAMAKMHEIDPNAKTMEGFISGYDAKGNPIIDPNFRMSFTEFGEWAKGYYGEDKTRLRKDFADIRGGQGALAVMEALLDGRYEQSLASVRAARKNNEYMKKAQDTLKASPERQSLVSSQAAQARQDIAEEPAAIFKRLWETERKNYQSAGATENARLWRSAGNWFNSWLNPDSHTLMGQARQLWTSNYLSEQEKNLAIFQYAKMIMNDQSNVEHFRNFRRADMNPQTREDNEYFNTHVYNAILQAQAGATSYTPVGENQMFNDDAVVAAAQTPRPTQHVNDASDEKAFKAFFGFIDHGSAAVAKLKASADAAAASMNNAAESADKAAQKLQNQVLPTPGQSGQLTPATL